MIPAYNEGAAVVPVLDRLFEAVSLDCEVLVVVDFEEDSTIPALKEYSLAQPRLRAVVNTYGPGPANAIRYGIDAAAAPVVVVTMADGCDDPRQIDDLTRLVERGVVVSGFPVCQAASRSVGPCSRASCRRPPAAPLLVRPRRYRDATNSFKAYSREFVQDVGIDSRDGFEIGS